MNNNTYSNNNNNNPLGTTESSYLTLMHLSQFAGILFTGLGFIIPIVMWAMNKDKNREVDRHGKNILNFFISYMIYIIILGVAAIIFLIGIITIPITIGCVVLMIAIALMQIIFIIIAAVKANNNEFWKYPLSIPFFNVD